jgi:hypothetical protein
MMTCCIGMFTFFGRSVVRPKPLKFWGPHTCGGPALTDAFTATLETTIVATLRSILTATLTAIIAAIIAATLNFASPPRVSCDFAV